MKWLITAFAPFGGAKSNSSLIILEHLRKRFGGGGDFIFHSPVPVEFQSAWNNIREVIDRSANIAGVLVLGQAESRVRICLERVALNFTDARMPDNAGFLPPLEAIQQNSPAIHWSNIPWEDFALSPLSERSYSAGTYVCNAVMYQSLDWAVAHQKKAGFVHFPVLCSQEEPQFEKLSKLDDQAAVEEAARILEFLLRI